MLSEVQEVFCLPKTTAWRSPFKAQRLTCLTVSRRNLVKQLDEVRLPGMRSTSRKRAPELPSARMRDRFGEIKLMREAV